ncbi:MAG: TAT-variant-translocated molybdopterin oxidoreductase, partial [Flavobacteriaceae bacterium]
MSSNKKYWKNVEEISPVQSVALTSLKHKEFVQEIPVDEFLGDKDALESSATT